MTYRVAVLIQAEIDIKSNARWWAENHSIEQAVRWFDAVYRQIDTLSELPTRCSLSAENDDFPYEIREKLVGLGPHPAYRAVFTIRGDFVYVLTIRRVSQRAISPLDIDSPPMG